MTEGDPWHDLAAAVLGSPKVQIPQSMMWKASFAGLSPLVRMWKEAQLQRLEAPSSAQALLNIPQYNVDKMEKLLSSLSQGRVITITMEEGSFEDVFHVGEVLHAQYGYQSLTADFIDVAHAVKRRYLKDGTLHLRGRDLTSDFRRDGLMSNPYLDGIRRVVRQKTRQLKLTYVSSAALDATTMTKRINKLSSLLNESGLCRSLHSRDGGSYYCLCEKEKKR